MASNINTNYIYTGKGPLDAKMWVKNASDLLTLEYVYNSMIVGVGLDSDISKRGLYYLNDYSVSGTFKAPDATKLENWHKLQSKDDIDTLLQLYVTETQVTELIAAEVEEVISVKNLVSIDTLETNLNILVAQIAQDDTATFTTLVESTHNLVAKLEGIDGTVVDAINSAIEAVIVSLPVATEDRVGGIKSTTGNNNVTVDNNGVARVETVDVSTLVQSEGTKLVLNGGTANE